MNPQPGAQIGPYRIDALIAEGGMGQVFLARDTRLNRPVALKFLSSDLADESARRRFQREAKMASALNHPHILTVHETGELDGRQYLVTEFIDGGTLKDWAAAEKPTWRQIVDLLIGVADGLAAAHTAGILHRDIKPANILVAKNGYAKLADFGLAKLAEPPPLATDATRTLTTGRTRVGVVLGTIAYMSPEQAAGKPLDARSDIFSFGVVLYELLAGRRPFAGDSDVELLSAIIHTSPAPLSDDIPLALRMVVDKALEQDPAERYQTMRDMVVDLRRLARRQTGEYEAMTGAGRMHATRQRVWPWMAAVTLALAVGVASGRWLLVRPAVATPTDVQLQRITDFVGIEEHPAVSPDGKTVAFIAPASGRRQVWVRLLAGGTPLQITHDDADHEHPRWAPDSSSLIYFSSAVKEGAPGTLWEVSALGGRPRRIASSQGEGDISHDGRRIATFQRQDNRMVLAILERDGSRVHQIRHLPVLAEFGSPRWSTDDRWLAFVGAVEIAFNRAVYVMNAAEGEPKAVTSAQNIRGLAWLPDGAGLVYASSAGSTMAYPPIFNLRTVSRDERQERQLTFGDVSYVQPDIVAAGKLFASRVRMQSDIWRFPVNGSPADNVKNGTRITQQTGQVQTPSASPDSKEVVYLSDSGGHVNAWVARVDGSGSRQITFERDPAVAIGIPVWSPAGDRIVMIQSRPGTNSEWLINPDGSGLRELVPRGAGAGWSRDGKWLYYFTPSKDSDATTCIEKIPLDGGSAVRVRCEAANMAVAADGSIYYAPSVSTPGEIRKAQPENGPSQPFAYIAPSRIPLVPQGYVLSPDDRWLTMPLTDAGTTNIWAFPTDGGPARQLTDFGRRPILIARQVSWSPDGQFVYAAVVETDADIVLLDGMLR
jgi:Tol biopolymer transport system component/predicted Ser/Thr protein kinase